MHLYSFTIILTAIAIVNIDHTTPNQNIKVYVIMGHASSKQSTIVEYIHQLAGVIYCTAHYG